MATGVSRCRPGGRTRVWPLGLPHPGPARSTAAPRGGEVGGLAMAAAVLLTHSGQEEAKAAMIGEVNFDSLPPPPMPKLRSHWVSLLIQFQIWKFDLLNALAELKRRKRGQFGPQDSSYRSLSTQSEEEWYDTDLALRCDMIQLLGKNKMVALAEVVFSGLLKEQIELDTRAYAEMLGAYLRADMIEKAMQTYEKMKAAGRAPNEFTMMILIRNLEKAGEKDLVEFVKRDCVEYLDSPKKFLE
ncbi:hypothetical protein NL676_013563 [Syzygium grande]|nr:hypothetical protein NL676_013563 [Syzygium grande]